MQYAQEWDTLVTKMVGVNRSKMLVIVFVFIVSIIMVGFGLYLQHDNADTNAPYYASISMIIFGVFSLLILIMLLFACWGLTTIPH